MIDPFRITGTTCISFSGGRTSAYMLWRVLQSNGGLPSEAVVCFANTGKEDEATLEFVRDCSERWGVPIVWLEYRPNSAFSVVSFDDASRAGEPFDAIIEQRGFVLPNPRSPYCSSEMKTRTMHRYLRSIGFNEWDSFLGIRADEPIRVAKFRANQSPETKDEEVVLPLVDAGVSRYDVSNFWASQEFDLGLKNHSGVTPEGNCDLCFRKHPARVQSLINAKPERAVWWALKEEKAAQHATGDGRLFRIDRPSYAAMLRNAQQQTDFIGHDQDEALACFCGD